MRSLMAVGWLRVRPLTATKPAVSWLWVRRLRVSWLVRRLRASRLRARALTVKRRQVTWLRDGRLTARLLRLTVSPLTAKFLRLTVSPVTGSAVTVRLVRLRVGRLRGSRRN
ncbi:hypothetical protein [Kribbella jejuensis]|uniref:Uncharacterized protein n=1 Tax=Kribbella jejuensis TaxID=236068 RepID=A0A542EAD2_9ACTN|nr:hypothetical protein [Kribbella jejuensis]TQJ12285.1 hypothetical protein FB475_5225 [Kribbella jejuensis]